MRLSFDSIEEVKEFVKGLKGTRGGKDKDDDAPATGNAPAPMQPPANQSSAGFPGYGVAAPAGAAAIQTAFPAAGAPQGPPPEITALVNRIVVKCEAAVQSGVTKVDDMLTWFRNQCGPDASQATWEQIKTICLPRLPQPALENIAKAMNA